MESMATELEDRCPICLDSWEEASFVVPCFHRFCYPCILRWAESKPECPLCKRGILSILHSVRADDDYMEHVITPSVTPSAIVRQAGGAAHDLHHPAAPQPPAAGGVPRGPVGGLQPEEWVVLFRDHPTLLETLLPWVQPRLRQIFRNNRMEAATVEDTLMAVLTNHGMDEELLVQMLGASLQNHTVSFVQQLMRVAVRRCGREARRLLGQQQGLPALAVPPPPDPAWRSSPAPHPQPVVGVLAASPLLPLPSPPEQEEPQEEPGQAVPGPSTSSRGTEGSPEGPRRPPKRRAGSSEASPGSKKPAPRR
ncbi:E3 ubiquitin-protein ligase Topors-like [Grus japonensis]|uniref:E3 ubiquitin-protein ligase Topors n=1 Tax=Grus japonensis TaxID=30415 RepID=A0ABC9Y5M8_GRUJA